MMITNETKLKFFAHNIGQEGKFLNAGTNWFRDRIESIDMQMESVNFFGTKNCRVVKTPLDKITKEDIYIVAKMQGFVNNNDFSICFSNGHFKWDDGNTWGSFIETTLYAESYQFLQDKGYALPFTTIENGKPLTLSVQEQIDNNLIVLK